MVILAIPIVILLTLKKLTFYIALNLTFFCFEILCCEIETLIDNKQHTTIYNKYI